MHGMIAARQAYQASARHRGLREQEADVFHRVNAVLRGARTPDPLTRTKALADNQRLWTTVLDSMRHPLNGLPPKLRASIISVGLAVQRENESETPDIGFLIGINEQISAGLSGM